MRSGSRWPSQPSRRDVRCCGVEWDCTAQNPEAKPGGILPGWQRVSWLCGNRSLGCMQAPLRWNHWGFNLYCFSWFSFDIRTFGGGSVYCTAAWVAGSTKSIDQAKSDFKTLWKAFRVFSVWLYLIMTVPDLLFGCWTNKKSLVWWLQDVSVLAP